MEGMGEYVRRFLRKQESLDSEGGRNSGLDKHHKSHIHQFLTHPILNPSPLTVAISFLSCPSSIALRK